jgi:hypothetical protein
MNKYGLEIELFTNGNVDVYKKTWHESNKSDGSGWLPATNSNLIAQWKEPDYIKIIDQKSVYYEIRLNEWSAVRKRNG